MQSRLFGGIFALALAALVPVEVRAQTDDTVPAAEGAPETDTAPAAEGAPETDTAPAAEGAPETEAAPAEATTDTDVPPVEVVQPKPKPQPQPVVTQPRPQPAPPPQPRPAPIEPEFDLPSEITEPLPAYYGPPGGQGNFQRSMESAQSPIVPIQGIIPGDLQDFAGSASRVTRQQIDEQEPLTTNDILQRIPGVAVINDDGLGRHGGVSVRGSPARRSRKILVMEDGRSINQSLWLDPSTHYVPPPDRIEEVEVLRGPMIVYGPNNNFGVVNFRNLQPFGQKETVVSAQGGTVQLGGRDLDGAFSGDGQGDASRWHIHTRQNSGNWGLVLSYSGANAQGAWDTERLRYNDFYGAIGWKGEKSDFTFSTVYFAQRDNYDESNFEGDDDDPPRQVLNDFFHDIKHCKTCFDPGSRFNEYNADILLMQGVYNYYVNQDTTVSARVYGQTVDRARFFNLEGSDPRAAEGNFTPIIDGDEVIVADGSMEGRLREFDHIGTELRTEFANRPFLFGLTQDMQVGARYEHHEFTDRAFAGRQGQILNGFDSRGVYVWNREHTADAFSAFFQTDIPVTERLNVVPGVRLEHYRISRLSKVLTDDDDDGDCPDDLGLDGEECIFFEGYTDDPFRETFTRTHVLPGVGFAWGFGAKETPIDYGSKSLKPVAKPQYNSTVYGGYHRGLTMAVLREAEFPPGDELGDNYEIGLRSTAIKGLTFDVSGFHKRITDYQIKSATTTLSGDKVFSLIDEVEVNGFEAYGRLDTRPFTGWTLNPYTEASYTLADSKIEKGLSEDGFSVAGNFVPEVPREVAYLTAGIESTAGWNASVSWIYRGEFYTDEENTPYGVDPEGENGLVPSVWLLAARLNYTVDMNGMQTVFFVSGENLTNKLYITDREDGLKPGIGRTIMAGAKIKW